MVLQSVVAFCQQVGHCLVAMGNRHMSLCPINATITTDAIAARVWRDRSILL